jgi:hypothetical protein
MASKTKIDFISNVFTTLVTTNVDRLRTGYKRREIMHKDIAAGKEPTGYRADFLRSSVKKVVGLLDDLAVEFNTLYQDDRISLHDFTDILQTTINYIKKDDE